MSGLDVDTLAPAIASGDFKSLEPILLQLEKHLTLRTYVSGYELSEADKKIWLAFRNSKVAIGLVRKGSFASVTRWFNYIEATHPEFAKEATTAAKPKKKAGANYNIGLENTENGVVTRFPPEPSGYLHIGHAKAALLNDYYGNRAYEGKMIVRFDDTNPSKEKQEYEDSIVEDVKLLEIKIDRITHTSDYFQELYETAERMIREGNAYADDTDQEIQKADRMNRLPSARRDRPAEESLAMFKEMKEGTELGRKHCIRARIQFDSNNGSMRDPIIYRFPNWADKEPAPHHRTGWTWNIYPTYDFACPVVDSREGVTHALRTTEYADRKEQYLWFLKALNIRPVAIQEFSRLNFIKTFLSKRKLTKVVDTGKVSGWDDPRMPTVRGIVRRGLLVAALRQFMIEQGPSRNIVTMDWNQIWSINSKMLEPTAPRHTAVEKKDVVVAEVANGPTAPEIKEQPKHPKEESLGTKKVGFSNRIFIDQADVATFAQDEKIALMGWTNAYVQGIETSPAPIKKLQLKLIEDKAEEDWKTTKKITWLSANEGNFVEAELWDFGYLITKDTLEPEDNLDDYLNPDSATMVEALVDANVRDLKAGQFLQLERKGFFRVDKALGDGPDGKAVLFKVPKGSK